MTGAELLAQVRLYLEEACLTSYAQLADSLDGCVLLTAEEAEKVRRYVEADPRKRTRTPRPTILALLGGERR